MGWNGSDQRGQGAAVRPAKPKKQPSVVYGVLAGALFVAVIGAVFYCLVGKDAAKVVKSPKRVKPAEEDIPAKSNRIVKTNSVKAPKPALQLEDENRHTAAEHSISNTSAAAITTNAEILAQLEKFKREPVKGLAEQLLVMVSPMKKGESMPPAPIGDLDSATEKEAERMLERVGKVEEWDDETSIAIKERLEALKDEWYQAKQAGMSFHAFLLKKQDQTAHDANILDEVRKFDEDNFNDSSMSDEEYIKQREKANNLLKIQGFDELPKRKTPEEEDAEQEEAEEAPAVSAKK